MDEMNKPDRAPADKPGWQFAGWYIDEACTKRLNPGGRLPQTMKLYPKWVPIVYPILYELEEGENSKHNPEALTAQSGIIKLYPAVSRGRQFAGWYWKGQKVDYLPEGITEPVKLKGVFHDRVRVHFDTQGGSRIDPVMVSDKGLLDLIPTPIRVGYVFTGWYTDPSMQRLFSQQMPVECDTVLYAGWRLAQYPLVFELNGGRMQGEMPSSYTKETPSFLLPKAVRSGYRFDGWRSPHGMKTTILRRGTIGMQIFTASWIEEKPQVFHIGSEKPKQDLNHPKAAPESDQIG